jgi:hypothetical protein
MNSMIREWVRRGYRNTMFLVKLTEPYRYPPWFGEPEFHAAHRSNLLRKDPEYYRKYWPEEPADMDYVWPVP